MVSDNRNSVLWPDDACTVWQIKHDKVSDNRNSVLWPDSDYQVNRIRVLGCRITAIPFYGPTKSMPASPTIGTCVG